jgi:hypothetical protein
METGRRLGLALVVVALLAGLTTVAPQLPANAAGQATFTNVFGDGDPIPNKQVYTVPDPFAFTEGAYVLAITATVYKSDEPVPSPLVDGKNLDWGDPIVSQNFETTTGEDTWFAVYQAWVDETSEPDENDMTFNFGPDATIYRHVRSFVESTEIDRDDEPFLQVEWGSGAGDPGMTGGVEFEEAFDDPDNSTTIFAITKHIIGEFDEMDPALTELDDVAVGAPGGEGADQLRLLTAYAPGEEPTPYATWTQGEAEWEAVGIEIVTDAHAVPTTTTTEATTTTTEATTTTTAPTTTTTVAETPIDDPFVDDDDSIFESDIEAIAQAGITLGCNPPTNDHFCPEDTLTRGQMAAFMARALDLTSNPIDRFVDDDTSVFENDIEAIAEEGITLGCNPPTNDRYCPENTLTRGQMAAFMARALGLTGDPVDRFVDDDTSVFENDIELIAEAGITLGCNPPANDHYCPGDTLTRGQMAAFLNRMLTYLGS